MAMSFALQAAYGANPASDSAGWVWTDLPTADVLGTASIRRGSADEGQAQPTQLSGLRLANPSGTYTPNNPLSTLYPSLRRNLPMRLRANNGSGWQTRFQGYLDELDLKWPGDADYSEVDFTASGVLRRLALAKPLRSALRRTIAASGPLVYWPGEDESGATSIAEAGGGEPMYWGGTGPSLGSGGPPGSAGGMTMPSGTTASLETTIPYGTTSTAWTVQFCVNIPSAPAGDTQVLTWQMDTGTYMAITIFPSGNLIGLECFDSAGTRIFYDNRSYVVGSIASPYGRDVQISASVRQSGANIAYAYSLADIATQQVVGDFGNIPAATLGNMVRLKVSTGYDHSGWNYSHVGVWTSNLDTSGTATGFPHLDAAGGFNGESAVDRMARLCAEEGVEFAQVGGTATTEAMGPQTAKTLVALLRECEDADGGLLSDGTTAGLTYLGRADRYNLAVTMALDAAARDVKLNFEPTADDDKAANDVTVSRSGGSSGHVIDQAHIDEHGLSATSLSLNVADDTGLLHRAGWEVNLGTVEEMRVKSIGMDLIDRPSLVAEWVAMSLGSRFTVVGLPVQYPPPRSLDSLLLGYTETIDAVTWRVVMNAAPAAPWRTLTVADASLGRLDTGGSELNAAITSSSTSLRVGTTVPPKWTTTAEYPADFPFDTVVDGEQMRVTAIVDTAVSYINIGTAAAGDNATLAPALPGTPLAGDLLLLYSAIRSGTCDTPAGYELLLSMGDAGCIFGKYAVTGEAVPSVTFSGGAAGSTTIAQIANFRGASLSVLNAASVGTGSQQNITTPFLGVAEDDCLIIEAGWKADAWTSAVSGGGFAEMAEVKSTLGNDLSVVWGFKIQTARADIPANSIAITGGIANTTRGGVVALRTNVQTFTVTRNINGAARAHAAGTAVSLYRPAVLAL